MREADIERACYMAAELELHDPKLLFGTALNHWCRVVVATSSSLPSMLGDVVAAVPALADCRAALMTMPARNPEEGEERRRRRREACCILLTTCAFPSRSFAHAEEKGSGGIGSRHMASQVIAASAAMSRAFPVVPPLCQEARELLARLWVLCKNRLTSQASETLKGAVTRHDTKVEKKKKNTELEFPRLSIEDLPGLATVTPANRGDVVWYVWRLCLLLCGEDADRKRFVRGALACYIHDYKKKDRNVRFPLLDTSLHVAASGLETFSASRRPRPDVDALLTKLFRNIHVVFEEMEPAPTEGGTAPTETLPESPPRPPKQDDDQHRDSSSVAVVPSENPQKDPAPFDEKMRCLYTLFYVDPVRRRRMEARRMVSVIRWSRNGDVNAKSVVGAHGNDHLSNASGIRVFREHH